MNLNVAYGINEKYFYLAMVSIHSLFCNNRKNDIYLYILYDKNLPQKCLELFNTIKEYPNCKKLILIEVDDTKYTNFYNEALGLYCFELPLQTDLKKVLYVHPSSIIEGDLAEVYNTDISKNSCASTRFLPEPIPHEYKNAFVFNNYFMILNLELFKEKKYYEELMSQDFIVRNNITKTNYYEILILNFLIDDCIEIPQKYSYAERWYSKAGLKCSQEDQEQYQKYLAHKEKPSVILYFGKKPYQRSCKHSYKNLWWKYAKQTPIYDDIKFYAPKPLIKKIQFFFSKKNKVILTRRFQNAGFYKKSVFLKQYVKPYLFRTIVALGLAIPIGCLDAIIALSLKPYMDVVMLEKQAQPGWYIPILIVAFTSVQGILNYLSTYMNDWVSGKISNDLKISLYTKLMHKSATFFDTKTSGDIQKRFNNDANSACNGLLGNIKLIISRVCSSISLLCVLFYNSWQLAIISTIILIIAILPVMKIKEKIKSVTNKSENANAAIITNYNEAYSGSKIVKAFNLYDFRKKLFTKNLKDVFNLKIKITQRTGIISPIMHVIVSVGIGIAIGYGSHLITTGVITPGNFVSFITALIMLYTPIKGLGNNAKSMTSSLLALERVVKNLDAAEYIIDKENAIEFNSFSNNIVFENVSFEYVKNKPVLKNINFEVKKGETFALVGNSGGGKSTIINLLPRFYKIKKGSIKIDGVDISNFKINSLRDNISIVLQDNFLFAGTIRENIMMGKLKATKNELENAIKNACLDEFIDSLEDGLDTYIGEKGVLLSGGQKQRIAIARAFLKDAPIVILDEATSALDNQSEAIVQKAIDNLMQDKTVFVIAHRLSTIQNADRIAVINEGKLVELGTHNELMNIESGQYKRLYEMQFKKQEEVVS